MAWQLIYTSAPRLLEAGRSGFGTVARHRAIPNLLAGAIERISQFSRLPGLGEHRIIYSHRHISGSGARFHVISRISDAGADYTGRTNHIAHHLIIDPREFANSPVSPADVILSFPWKTSWGETPRYFDSGEEVSLGSIQQRVHLPAQWWGTASGNKRYAALLVAPEVARGCYLIYQHDPTGDIAQQFAVHLFGESLLLTGNRMWAFPFTTNFQPSDDAADFLWSGVWASSPVRNQIAQTERMVLSLETGGVLKKGTSGQASIPIGAAADLAETGRSAAISPAPHPTISLESLESENYEQEILPDAPEITQPSVTSREPTIQEQDFVWKPSVIRKSTTLGPSSARPAREKLETQEFLAQQPHRRKLWIPAVVAAGVVVVLFSFFGYSYLVGLWQTNQQHWNEVRDSLSAVPGHTDADVDELIKEMGGYNQGEVDTIKILANKWQKDLATTAGNNYREIEDACANLRNIKLPTSLSALVARVSVWLKLRDRVINDAVDDKTYKDYTTLCKTVKDQDSQAISSDDVSRVLIQYNVQRRIQFLTQKLAGYLKPISPFTLEWFQTNFSDVQHDIPKSFDGNITDPTGDLERLGKTLDLWSSLQTSKNLEKETTDLKADQFHENDKVPEWLKKDYADFEAELAQKAKVSSDDRDKSAKATEPPNKDATKDEAQTGYIVLGDEGLRNLTLPFNVQKLKTITVEKDSETYPLGTQIDGFFNKEGKCFQITDAKIVHISLGAKAQPQPEYVLMGNDPDSQQPFAIHVLDKPLNPKGGGLITILDEIGHQIITVDASLMSWKHDMRLPSKASLRLPSGFESPLSLPSKEKLLPFDDYKADISPIITKMMDEKKRLESQLSQPAPAPVAVSPADSQSKINGKLQNLRSQIHTTSLKDQIPKDNVSRSEVIHTLTSMSRAVKDNLDDKAGKAFDQDIKLVAQTLDEINKMPIPQTSSEFAAKSESTQSQARDELKLLNDNPLLQRKAKLPAGDYTVFVSNDAGGEYELIDFTIRDPLREKKNATH